MCIIYVCEYMEYVFVYFLHYAQEIRRKHITYNDRNITSVKVPDIDAPMYI